MNWKVEKQKPITKENLDFVQDFLHQQKRKYQMMLQNEGLRPEMQLEWQHAINAIDVMLIEIRIKYKRLEVE